MACLIRGAQVATLPTCCLPLTVEVARECEHLDLQALLRSGHRVVPTGLIFKNRRSSMGNARETRSPHGAPRHVDGLDDERVSPRGVRKFPGEAAMRILERHVQTAR